MTTEAIKALVELEKRMKLGIAVCSQPSPGRVVGFTISADEAKTILAAIEALKPLADVVGKGGCKMAWKQGFCYGDPEYYPPAASPAPSVMENEHGK